LNPADTVDAFERSVHEREKRRDTERQRRRFGDQRPSADVYGRSARPVRTPTPIETSQ
jgi:hypothetical protein